MTSGPSSSTRPIWLALPFVFLIWVGFLQPIRLMDFWWHLRTGQFLVETRTIPRTDMYSFTVPGKEFVLQNWLAEVIYYSLYRAGGFPLLIAGNTALLTLALWFAVRTMGLEQAGPEVSAPPAGVVAGLALVLVTVLSVYSGVRTQVFSFALFAYFFWAVQRYRAGSPALIWSLPPLVVLWANLHGAFILGIGLLALVMIGEFSEGRLASCGRLAPIILACLAAPLVNPEFVGLYHEVLFSQSSAAVQTHVLEWQPPQIDRTTDILLFFGPFFLVVAVLLLSPRRASVTDVLLVLAFTAFALKHRRNGVWFALVGVPLAANYLRAFRWTDWIPERASRVSGGRNERLFFPLAIALVLLVATVAFSPWVRPRLQGRASDRAWVEPATPVEAVDFIVEQNLEGRIFHPQSYGSYLIWRAWPSQKTFFDDRTHLFSESIINDYLAILRAPNWQEHLDHWNIQFLFLDRQSADSRALTDRAELRWKVLYFDEQSVILERADKD